MYVCPVRLPDDSSLNHEDVVDPVLDCIHHFFMQSVDTTMLYIAPPAIAEALHQPVLHMELIVISYVVTVLAFTPVNGWMAERLGERNTYLVAIAIFMS